MGNEMQLLRLAKSCTTNRVDSTPDFSRNEISFFFWFAKGVQRAMGTTTANAFIGIGSDASEYYLCLDMFGVETLIFGKCHTGFGS